MRDKRRGERLPTVCITCGSNALTKAGPLPRQGRGILVLAQQAPVQAGEGKRKGIEKIKGRMKQRKSFYLPLRNGDEDRKASNFMPLWLPR